MPAPDVGMERLKIKRGEIDDIDSKILAALAVRCRLVQRVWDLKAEMGIPPLDEEREAQIRTEMRRRGNATTLNMASIDELTDLLLSVAKRECESTFRGQQ